MAKLADKYAIGTEHVIDGITVIVEEPKRPLLCNGCVFSFKIGNNYYCNLPPKLKNTLNFHSPVCYDCERLDGKNVIFRRKEQQ